MEIRSDDPPTDPAILTEMVLALVAENEKLRISMQTLKDMIFGKRSERLAVIVKDQLALELGDVETAVTTPDASNANSAPQNLPGQGQRKWARPDKAFPIILHGSSSCDEDRLGPSEQPSDPQCGASRPQRGGHTDLQSSFRLAQTPGVWRALDQWLRRRLGAIQLKQWRSGRTIFRELTALGASADVAHRVAGNCHCWWRNSGMLLASVLTIAWADQLGVPRLA